MILYAICFICKNAHLPFMTSSVILLLAALGLVITDRYSGGAQCGVFSRFAMNGKPQNETVGGDDLSRVPL